MNREMSESEPALFGLQFILERDNDSLVVVSVAPRFKFNAKRINGLRDRGPSWQRSNEWEGAFGVRRRERGRGGGGSGG